VTTSQISQKQLPLQSLVNDNRLIVAQGEILPMRYRNAPPLIELHALLNSRDDLKQIKGEQNV